MYLAVNTKQIHKRASEIMSGFNEIATYRDPCLKGHETETCGVTL